MDFRELWERIVTDGAPYLGQIDPQLAVLGLSIVFFALAAGICALAMGAATNAQSARRDADAMLRTVQDYALEVRQLSANVERASHGARESRRPGKTNALLSDRIRGVRIGSRYHSGEADVAIDAPEDPPVSAEEDGYRGDHHDDGYGEPGEAHHDDVDETARLQSAARAASEPRSLLSGMLRRR